VSHSVSTDARSRWRVVAVWAAVGALLLVAFASAVGALNREVYSAGGFVRQYLDALNRHDAAGALEMPGVALNDEDIAAAGLPEWTSKDLLRPSLTGGITDIELVDDRRAASGVHYVTYRYTVSGQEQSSRFQVRSTGVMWGLFPSWEFVRSPLAPVQVNVLHASRFQVAGLTLDTRATAPEEVSGGFNTSATYLMFSPGSYTFSHSSPLLIADPVTTRVTDPSSTVQVNVDTRATQDFVDQVQEQVNAYLDECTTQTVLQPSGCPFGVVIENRIQGPPQWSMSQYPEISIQPGETSWYSPPSQGAAHITVEVKSLFDGTLSLMDEDEPFTMSLQVDVRPDGSLDIHVL